ncbi:hypothetical protein ATO11_10645 [Pseudaestuariivita atlantica]|uniref:Acyltransferase 3 domain-containing protein n=2 Tax=Pseudaestuariivita atlantica TaxID=1317121 RepID=A0A0L1JQF3_9RHOB|nr:hypothetical protein ATO11_10645 [Pseudaestuariivita atlantica]
MGQSARFVWLDACRLIAGVSMVGLHATADANGQPWVDYDPGERVLPMLLRAVIYTARTELFIVISIFLLMMALDRRPRGYRQTIAEQSRRLLVPFAFWVVFYAAYTLIKADSFGYADAWLAQLSDPAAWAGFLVLGDVKYHMHFIPTLFGLVLFYPLFRIAVAHPWTGFVVLACLIVKRELDVMLWSTFWSADWLPWAVRAVKIVTYIGYGMVAAAFWGIWSRTRMEDRAPWVPLILFVGGLMFLIKLVATYKTVETGAWPHSYTPGYWADFLMPVALFALCLCLAHKAWPPVLSRLAPYSFGIYLCHPIFLDMAEIALKGTDLAPMAQIGIKIGWALPATTLFVIVLSKLPPLAWTVGLGPLPRLRSRAARIPQQET